jgi:hypothetical protein
MLDMKMISLLPSASLEGGLGLLNKLKWNISVRKEDDVWLVFGGEKCLLKSSSKESAEAFVYGLSLAYGTLPDDILDQVQRHAQGAAGE